MLKLFLGSVFVAFGLIAGAQVSDDFTDGELLSGPNWTTSVNAGLGGASPFRVEEGRLRLVADPSVSKAWISTPSEAIHNAQWDVEVRLDFNPSSSNLLRFYLASDKKELDQPLNGYFVQIGGTQDEVSLFRQSGTTIQKVIDGEDGRVNQALVRIKIRVTVNENGRWTLYSDSGLIGTWTEEGSGVDRAILSSTWTGFLCQFTATRSDKFWFDNFSISGSKYPDRIPPKLASSQFIDSVQLALIFSEQLDPSASNPSNFSLSVKSVQFAGQTELRLVFSLPWINGSTSPLKVSSIRDLAGNVMRDTMVQLLYFRAGAISANDVVINEIMADPVPSRGLAQTEYVEIFNRSSNPISLDRWVLSDGSQAAKLPQHILLPKGFAVLYPPGNTPPVNSDVALAINGFPSLNNSGDRVMLFDQKGMFVDSVRYSSGWYRNSEKAEGGWSLERIDPNDLCGEEENWTSTENFKGGTPGQVNSVYAVRMDRTPPAPVYSKALGDQKIQLVFNERMQPDSLREEMLTIEPELEWFGPRWENGFKKLMIGLKTPLDEGTLYKVRIKNVRDCAGNFVSNEGLKFGVAKPQEADSMDVVVNEILFNPYPGGVDYVELYNRSKKYFDLERWSICNDTTQVASEFSHSPMLLGPGGYAVLTDDPSALKLFYSEVPDSVLLKYKLPSLPDDEGAVFLKSPEGKWIDQVYYSKNFHSPLLRSEEGISLERIDASGSGLLPGNWRSAAHGSTFSGKRYGGTPGAPNSNRFTDINERLDFQVSPEVFNPMKLENGFTRVIYQFNRPELFGSVFVFDWNGHRVKEIANNELLPGDGFFRWDGDDESGNPVDPGFYLIVFEVHDSSGFYRLYRKRVVIAPG
ncbi:MAG: lamin tail domain-containing protein [Bacteroidetes bacterium]|nr:lamin tail domain-containing protein [Bacteroidota bacterium]